LPFSRDFGGVEKMKKWIFLVFLAGCGNDKLKRVPAQTEVIYSDDPCDKERHSEVPDPLEPGSPEEFPEEDGADSSGPGFPPKHYPTESE
jgi:hypothetical protein